MKAQLEQAKRKRALIVYSASFLLFSTLTLYLLWALRSLLLPLIIGLLLAYIVKPILNKFRYAWLPEGLRVLMLLSLIITSLVYLSRLIKDNIPKEKDQLILQVRMKYKVNERFVSIMGIDQKTGKGNFFYQLIKDEIHPFMASLNRVLQLTPEQRKKFELHYKEALPGDPIREKYYDYFQSNLKSSMLDLTKAERKLSSEEQTTDESGKNHGSLLGALFNTLSTWLLMPFVFIFMLFDKGKTLKFFVQLVPNRFFELALTVVDEVDMAIGNYLRGTILECSLVGATLCLGLYLIGIEFNVSLIIGLVAGFTNAIPFLGPVIGLVVGLSYALIAENIKPLLPFIDQSNLFFAVVVCVMIAQLLDNVIFQPIVLGKAVNLHPLVVIIGVMGGSVIFGFSGMLLAIPTIVIFKVITETLFKELKDYRII